MEEKIIDWIKKNKQLFGVSVFAGFLLTPFLWPFFLSIVYSTLSLAVPIFIILVGLKMPWKCENSQEKEAECEAERETKHYEEERKDMNEQRKDAVSSGEHQKTTDMPQPQKGKPDAAKCSRPDERKSKEEIKAAISWYVMEGKSRILRIASKMEKQGYNWLSIGNDGMCSVKTEDGYRRVGALRDFPKNQMAVLAEKLNEERSFHAKVRGKYLYLFWGNSGAKRGLL